MFAIVSKSPPNGLRVPTAIKFRFVTWGHLGAIIHLPTQLPVDWTTDNDSHESFRRLLSYQPASVKMMACRFDISPSYRHVGRCSASEERPDKCQPPSKLMLDSTASPSPVYQGDWAPCAIKITTTTTSTKLPQSQRNIYVAASPLNVKCFINFANLLNSIS